MTCDQLSSFVFVGQFPPGFLDERELFGGIVDPQSVIRINPVTQCSYASGKYQFSFVPDRIDVKATENAIISDELEMAASTVARKIDGLRNIVSVTGMGMNCDGVIAQSDIGKSGADYCAGLVSRSVADLTGASEFQSGCRIEFNKKSFRYQVRFEPHAISQGQHLSVAVNGHQNVDANDMLTEKLKYVDEFRKFVEGFHQRVIQSKEN